MKTALINGEILNVYTDSLEHKDILIEDGIIQVLGQDLADQADQVVDLTGKILVPGLIDAHMHIESTMMTPAHLSGILLRHGTTTIVADPHEIANVLGVPGIRAMMDQGKQAHLDILWTLPSCVPATAFDITGATLKAEDLKPLWQEADVVGLAEVMNAPGVLAEDPDLMEKIREARSRGKVVNGHAPGLTGDALCRYIAAGITDDHECETLAEAKERIENGMTVFIREGTAARDLEVLAGLFQEPWNRHCALCTDDRHPSDLVREGHIDHIIRKAAALGLDPKTAIRMATLQAAQYYGLRTKGAIAPGMEADLVVLDDLDRFEIDRVYKRGQDIKDLPEQADPMSQENSMHLESIDPSLFRLPVKQEQRMRVIGLRDGQLITDEQIRRIDPEALPADVALATLLDRHQETGRHFTGLVGNTGLQRGAIASSIGHDSHNLLVIGRSEEDMALAARTIREMQGGLCTVAEGQVLAKLALPVAGLMAQEPAEVLARQEEALQQSLTQLGMDPERSIFMTMSFMSLPVIPQLKLSVHGLVDVDNQKIVDLVVTD